VDQLTVLAEAFGEPMTPQRLEIYATDLADIDQAALAAVFVRARREFKFFPKIAELRQMALPTRRELECAGATAAWEEVWQYLSKWGVARQRHAVYGECPTLDARTEFAIRAVGGLNRINRCSDHEYGFIQRKFEEAWQSYDVTKDFGGLGNLAKVLDGWDGFANKKALPE
jgi:hypothetical protein